MHTKVFKVFLSILILFNCSCSQRVLNHSHSDSVDINNYSKKYVKSIMSKVYEWQFAHPLRINFQEDWARAAFFTGAMRAYKITHDNRYIEGAMHYADSLKWRPGKRLRHADDLACGQVFLDIYAIKKDPKMIAAIKNRLDTLITTIKPDQIEWWWCDALFMAPPVCVRLGQLTGDAKYYNYMNVEWWKTTALLFDEQENLYSRDKDFINKRTANGKKMFWSRGNGWVMGGLVQLLEHLPKNDTYYNRYLNLYKKMSVKIASLQQPDGLWRPSLLDPSEVQLKETSGSAFYTFALAWGINNGYLDRNTYLPIVKKGWKALTDTVEPSGKLTWVQQIGAAPASVKQTDNQEYGSGAFLMAGTELIKMNIK